MFQPLGKISAQPHPTLCIQFLNRGNNDKNNTFPLGKQICFTIVWGCAETLPAAVPGSCRGLVTRLEQSLMLARFDRALLCLVFFTLKQVPVHSLIPQEREYQCSTSNAFFRRLMFAFTNLHLY